LEKIDIHDTTPPTVTGNEPTGTNVPVMTVITVTFDESMNTTSVEDAFSIAPSVAGTLSWSSDTMTFTPDSNLTSDTTYEITIGTGAEDLAGNPLAVPYTWDFTTAEPDTTAPTVTDNTPTGTDVSVMTVITVTFNESMNTTSVEDAFSIAPSVAGTLSWSGDTMTFAPDADLTSDTTYEVTIGTGAKDLSGNPLAAAYIWDFTTAAESDNIIQNPGFESGTSPWLFYTSGTGTFSMASPGFEGSNAAKLALNSGGKNIQLYQTGVTLEPNTHYRLSFAGYSTTGHDVNVRLIKHVSPYTNYGLDLMANLGTNWQTFTTDFTTTGFTGTVNDGRLMFWLAPFAESGDTYYIDDIRLEKIDIHDTTPPTVTGNEPTGTNVPVMTVITVTFDESMNTTSVEDAFSIAPSVAGTLSWSGDTMTFTPDSDLTSDTTYEITIGTGAEDLAGNPLAAAYTWDFTTAEPDTTAPTVTDNTPTGTDVSVTTVITVTFNESMNTTSVEDAFSIGPSVAGTLSWSGDTMTFIPTAALAYSTMHEVTIGTGAEDLAGNPLAAAYIWDFTTAAESDNIIQNPGFESGTSPWLFYTNGIGTFLNDASGAGSPHASHITISQEGSNVQLYQPGLVLEPNTQYRLSFKAYSNTGHDLSISLHKHGSPYTNYGLSDDVVNLGTSWSEYSTQFTTSGFSGTVNDGRLRFWLAPYDAIGDQYFIDDVILVKV